MSSGSNVVRRGGAVRGFRCQTAKACGWIWEEGIFVFFVPKNEGRKGWETVSRIAGKALVDTKEHLGREDAVHAGQSEHVLGATHSRLSTSSFGSGAAKLTSFEGAQRQARHWLLSELARLPGRLRRSVQCLRLCHHLGLFPMHLH